MWDLKLISVAGVASGTLLTGVSGNALAQSSDYYSRDKYEAVTERRQPEFDPEPIRLGAFVVNSSLSASISYTSNALGTSSNEESDTIARIGADVLARTNWSVHEIGASVSASRDEYQDFSSESSNDLRARAFGRLDVTREINVGAAVFVQEGSEKRYDPSSSAGLRTPIDFTRTGVEVSANYTNDRVRWSNVATVSEADYDDAVTVGGTPIDQDFRDRTNTEFRSRLTYALTPNLAVFGQGSVDQREYDNPSLVGAALRSRDSTSYTASVGADFELDVLLRGNLAVGYLTEEMDDSFFSGSSGLAVDGRLQWFPSRLTTVTFNGSRRTIDSGIQTAASSFMTDAGVQVDHELRRNVILSAYTNFTNYEFEEIDRSDDVVEFGLLSTYKVNKRVHLNAFARRISRERSGAAVIGDQDFETNLLGIGIRIYP